MTDEAQVDLDELERMYALASAGDVLGGDPDRRREEDRRKGHAQWFCVASVPILAAELRALRLANASIARDLDSISGMLADMGDVTTDEVIGVGEVCRELKRLRARELELVKALTPLAHTKAAYTRAEWKGITERACAALAPKEKP
jgi:hypothetical protein